MNLQLAAISAKVAPGRHAALLLDQAGWHTTPQLTVPANISIVPLPDMTVQGCATSLHKAGNLSRD